MLPCAADGAPDIHALLGKQHGAKLSTDLSQGHILGLIPEGEVVWCTAVAVPAVQHTAPAVQRTAAAGHGQQGKSSESKPVKELGAGKSGEGKARQGQAASSSGRAGVSQPPGGLRVSAAGKGGRPLALSRCTAALMQYEITLGNSEACSVHSLHTLRLTPLGSQPAPDQATSLNRATVGQGPLQNRTHAAGTTVQDPASLRGRLILTSVTLSCEVSPVSSSGLLPGAGAASGLGQGQGCSKAGRGQQASIKSIKCGGEEKGREGLGEGTRQPGLKDEPSDAKRVCRRMDDTRQGPWVSGELLSLGCERVCSCWHVLVLPWRSLVCGHGVCWCGVLSGRVQ